MRTLLENKVFVLPRAKVSHVILHNDLEIFRTDFGQKKTDFGKKVGHRTNADDTNIKFNEVK